MSTTWGLLRRARKLAFVLPFSLAAFVIVMMPGNTRRTCAAIQEKETKNPFAGDPKAVQQGRSYFRLFCGPCHGNDARGGLRAPGLTSGRWTHGSSDAAIFRTITQGVPGTQMPASGLTDEETWMIIAYLRNSNVESRPPVAGNREVGERIFVGEGLCSQCHMVNGKGGRLGPDLSRIGVARPAAYLVGAIREPSKHLMGLQDIPQIYDTVTAVTREGQRITGIARNEDTFSLQLMDQQEQLHFFLKKELKELIHEKKSLMPAYSEQMLNAKQLQDLLAYLDGLRRE